MRTSGEIKTFTMIELSSQAQQAPDWCDSVCLYHTTELGIGHVGGLMPYGNANQIVREMCLRIRPDSIRVPVYAGVCGTDPTALTRPFLRELKKLGVTGVQNFPSVGMADQIFRCNLEAVHLAYSREVTMLMTAEEEGLNILPFAFSLSDAIALSRARPETVVYDLGFAGAADGREANTARYVEQICAVSCRLRRELPGVSVLLHVRNGRLREFLALNMSRLGIDGFYISRRAEPQAKETLR